MYASQIRLRNWKNFKEAKAFLTPRAFVIGPNASGKSNLLDAFRFLRDVADTGLAPAVKSRGGVSALRCLAATKYSAIDIEIELSRDDGVPAWRYEVVLSQDNVSRPIVKKEIVTQINEKGVVLRRPNPDDENDPLLLTQTALEQVSANREFRELSDFLKTITYQHVIPQAVRDPKGFTPTPVRNDPFGRDFLFRLWNTQQTTRDRRLKNIVKGLAVAVPQLKELYVRMDPTDGTPHLAGRYEHWRAQGAFQNEAQFSDGTLRLFGLLWSMFEGSGPLLLEEPELSLHAEVVRRLPQVMKAIDRQRKTFRQVILSTHSYELLSDRGISAEEVLILKPGPHGTVIEQPPEEYRSMMKAGLSAGDVLLPRSAPPNVTQLELAFDLPLGRGR